MIELEKNNREVIRISKNNYKEKDYVDLRVYYKDKTSGDMLPSKKGISVALDKFKTLMKGLCDFADAEGLA
jgi:hypothetical protein